MIEENNVINFETYDYYIHSIGRIGYEKFFEKIKDYLKKIDVKQIDKMYEKIREQEFIYDDQEEYWDYRRYR